MRGDLPNGERYRLGTGQRPTEPDDVDPTWCLSLTYTGKNEISVIDARGKKEPERPNQKGTCGVAPQPRISGEVDTDCDAGLVFIYGAARSVVHTVEVVTDQGKRIVARRADLPKGAGFAGTSYLVAIRTGELPAELHATPGDSKPVVTLDAKAKVCPRSPDGQYMDGFASFPAPTKAQREAAKRRRQALANP